MNAAGAADVWFTGDADVTVRKLGSALGVADGTIIKTEPNINSTGVVNMYLISTNTTLTETHDNGTIEASSTISLTLTDAATLTSGWRITVRNVGSGTITMARDTGSDTIDGAASNITIPAGKTEKYQVNNAAGGFITIGDADEVSSILTGAGDMVYSSAANTLARLAAGNAGAMPSISPGGGSVQYWAVNDHYTGLALSLAADTEHDITVATGTCANSINTHILKSPLAITKQIDETWLVGSTNGGMRAGDHPVQNTTQYFVYLIHKDSDGTLDVIYSTEASSPTLPTGYTVHQWLGWVYTDGSANIDYFFYKTSANTLIGDIASSSLGAGVNEITASGIPHGFGTDNIMLYGNGLNINEDGLWEMDLYGGAASNIKLIGYKVTSTTNSSSVAPGANKFSVGLTNRGAGAQVINVRVKIEKVG